MNIVELKDALERINVNPHRYDLNGGTPFASEGLVLAKDGQRWLVRHFERGSWYTLGAFDSEEAACDSLLAYASDPFFGR